MHIAPRKPALWPLLMVGAMVLSGALRQEAARAEPAATPAASDDAPADEPAAEAPQPNGPANAGEWEAETDAAWPDMPGQAGVWPTPPRDPTADGPENLTTSDLYDRITYQFWPPAELRRIVAITCLLVVAMQAGFAMFGAGIAASSPTARFWWMNLLIFPLCGFGFWTYGFALGWGNWFNGPVAPGWYPVLGPGLSELNSGAGLVPAVDEFGNVTGVYKFGLLGTKGFFLHGCDSSVMLLFISMLVFLVIAATIPIGAVAGRWNWKRFGIYGIWAALPYCVYANWTWGGGWLAQAGMNWGLGHGVVDCAGSGVVHAMGGVIALAGCLALVPRRGATRDVPFAATSSRRAPQLVIGAVILALAWLYFNQFLPTGTEDNAQIALQNCVLSSFVGAVAAPLVCTALGNRPDLATACSGALSGLVAIAAPFAFVDSVGAAIIGGVAGTLYVLSRRLLARLGVDDVVGAISIHGTSGIWGMLSLGLLATGEFGVNWNGVVREQFTQDGATDGVRGLFYGDPSQFVAQLLGAGVLLVFGFSVAFAWFKLSNFIVPIEIIQEAGLRAAGAVEGGPHSASASP